MGSTGEVPNPAPQEQEAQIAPVGNEQTKNGDLHPQDQLKKQAQSKDEQVQSQAGQGVDPQFQAITAVKEAYEAQHKAQEAVTSAIAKQMEAQEKTRQAYQEMMSQEDVAKQVVRTAAEQTKAAADAAVQRATVKMAQSMTPLTEETVDKVVSARQTATLEQASQFASQYSHAPPARTVPVPVPAPTPTVTAPIPASQHLHAPPVLAPVPVPAPTVTTLISTPSPVGGVEQGVRCQKLLYEVANQTAAMASSQMIAAQNLYNTSGDASTQQAARGRADIAQRNMELAQQMAIAAQSPDSAVQALAAMQQTSR